MEDSLPTANLFSKNCYATNKELSMKVSLADVVVDAPLTPGVIVALEN